MVGLSEVIGRFIQIFDHTIILADNDLILSLHVIMLLPISERQREARESKLCQLKYGLDKGLTCLHALKYMYFNIKDRCV